mgnify:CR=1 FL=1|tara:strand:+ start:269 stop:817 length:549 start_codon:yes stop_codon:yes gene_type:complete
MVFGNLFKSVTNWQDRINNLNGTNSRLIREKRALSNRYDALGAQHGILNTKFNQLTKQASKLEGKLLSTTDDMRISASKRFNDLKNQYLKKIELIDTQEELLASQTKDIMEYDSKIKSNEKAFEKNNDHTSTYSRKLIYDSKDVNFYGTIMNILKILLLIISVAVIYLLLKKNPLKKRPPSF